VTISNITGLEDTENMIPFCYAVKNKEYHLILVRLACMLFSFTVFVTYKVSVFTLISYNI
jgi:hypothetical protein